MKCTICKHGETSAGEITLTLEKDNSTLVFKNVPAEVCNNCGESYIDEKVTKQLFAITEDAVKNGVEIDIRKFSNLAPVIN